MILKNYPYHPIDRIFAPLRYYDEKLAMARKHGFDCWYSFVVEAYDQLGSAEKLAKLCGMTKAGVLTMLRKFGIERRRAGSGWYDRKGMKRRRM